jgi:hypothetical protein
MQPDQTSFCAAANSPCYVAQGRRASTARKYEIPQRHQAVVVLIQLLFQTPYLSLIHGQAVWYAEVSSEIEQVVLYIFQAAAQNFFKTLCKQQADIAIQFIHGTHGLYAQAFLSAPAAISQSRGAIVPCAGVDSGKTISH